MSVNMSANMQSVDAGGKLRCRTCYDSGVNLISLHSICNDAQKSLAELVFIITKIDTKADQSDALPKQICGDCSRKLKSAYCFVQQAHRVNEQLLSSLPVGVANEADSGKQHSDCLLETPIDMPSGSYDCLQIKMETDYGDENVYPPLARANIATDTDVNGGDVNKNKSTSDKQKRSREEADVGFIVDTLKLEDSVYFSGHPEKAGSSNEAYTSLDPITVAETNWTSGDNNETDNCDFQHSESFPNNTNFPKKLFTLNESDEFRRAIIDVKPLDEKINHILQRQEELANMVAENNILLRRSLGLCSTTQSRFPLNVEERLEELEEDLAGEQRQDIVALMRKITSGQTKNIEKIFGEKVIMAFNYAGAKDKKALKMYGHIMSALYEATSEEGRSHDDFVSELRVIFRKIKNRCNKQQLRKKEYSAKKSS